MRFPVLLLLTASLAVAQDDPFADVLNPEGSGKQVTPSLVSEQDGIVAGKPFTVAVKMEHAPGWHTYWINPGIGNPVSVDWKLPEGFSAGPILWPVPHIIEGPIGNLHAYENTAYLLTEITAPATLTAGTSIELGAKVKWMVCDEASCINSSGDVRLKLTVKEPVINEAVKKHFDAVRAQQPQHSDAWKVEISEAAAAGEDNPATVTFTLTPGENANPDPGAIYFFDASKVLETDPQKPESKDGKIILTIARKEVEAGEKPPAPAGFIYAPKGWLKDGSVTALAVATAHDGGGAGTSTTPPATETDPFAAGGEKPAGAGEVLDKSEWELDATPEDYVEYSDTLTLKDLMKGGAKTTERGFWTILLFMFLGGMILNLMPCVFPVLGIKILGFAQLAGHQRRKLLLHAAAFTAGIILFVWALGAVIGLAAHYTGREFSWGALTQNSAGLAVVIILLFLLGLNLCGVFEMGTSLTSVGGNLQDKAGYAGSFWSGALTTVVATPCSGPFLGPAMFYTLAQPLVPQFVLLTAFGLGIAAPYAVLSTSPKLVKKLPRPGAWMETFKKALAFPMFAAAIFFLHSFMELTGTGGATLLLCALLVVAVAAWIYGHWDSPMRVVRTRWIARAVSLAVLGTAVWVTARATAERGAAGGTLADGWQRWSPKKVRDLRDQRRSILVDYTTPG
jgi:DsbC/DsbD-like thiol-disulfide interchange protein/cytochrome c biogenesis protein CcdA